MQHATFQIVPLSALLADSTLSQEYLKGYLERLSMDEIIRLCAKLNLLVSDGFAQGLQAFHIGSLVHLLGLYGVRQTWSRTICAHASPA